METSRDSTPEKKFGVFLRASPWKVPLVGESSSFGRGDLSSKQVLERKFITKKDGGDRCRLVKAVVDEFEDCFKQVSIEPKDLVEHERGGMGSIIEEMGRPCGSEGLGPEDSMAGCDGLNQGGEEALYHREDTDLGAPKEDDQDVLAGVSQEKKWKRRARIGG